MAPMTLGQTIGNLVANGVTSIGKGKPSAMERAFSHEAGHAAAAAGNGPRLGYDMSPFFDDTTVTYTADKSGGWSGDDWKIGMSPDVIAQAEMGRIRFISGGPPAGATARALAVTKFAGTVATKVIKFNKPTYGKFCPTAII